MKMMVLKNSFVFINLLIFVLLLLFMTEKSQNAYFHSVKACKIRIKITSIKGIIHQTITCFDSIESPLKGQVHIC